MANTTDTRGYWRANLRLLSSLLVVWFVVSYGFGILGHSMELYLCARDDGRHPKRSVDVWYHYDNGAWYLEKRIKPRQSVCNEQLLTMWRRVFHINDAVGILDKLNRMLPPGDQEFRVGVPHPWDDHALLDRLIDLARLLLVLP